MRAVYQSGDGWCERLSLPASMETRRPPAIRPESFNHGDGRPPASKYELMASREAVIYCASKLCKQTRVLNRRAFRPERTRASSRLSVFAVETEPGARAEVWTSGLELRRPCAFAGSGSHPRLGRGP